MEWPRELLELFDDPLLDGVRPKVSAPTADDRMSQKLAEVMAWIERNGREPARSGDLKEKMMWAAMRRFEGKNDVGGDDCPQKEESILEIVNSKL